MLICLLIYLLVSNAVALKRDKSILYSRVVIKSLGLTSFLAFNSLFVKAMERAIDIHRSLLITTRLTQPYIYILLAVKTKFNYKDITINSASSITIYILAFLLTLFMYMPGEWFNIVNISINYFVRCF